MSFEHRIVGGDRSDDGDADGRDDEARYAADRICRDEGRLRDIDTVESLDNLDVLADQLRDDARYLFVQFPVDEKQLTKFAGQFRGDDATDEVLREHVDEEMQKCLRRIELLDVAERRNMRRRIKLLLGAIGGSVAIILVVTMMIHQLWFQVPESSQSRAHRVPVAVGSSNTVALSKSNDVVSGTRLATTPVTTTPAAEVTSPETALEFTQYQLLLNEAGTSQSNVKMIPLRIVETVDEMSPEESVHSIAVPMRRLVETKPIVQESSPSGPVPKFGEYIAQSSNNTASANAIPVSDSSSASFSTPIATPGFTGISILPGIFSGQIPRSRYNMELDAMPSADEVPEVYRSASEPEMEGILDLIQLENDGSITIEF